MLRRKIVSVVLVLVMLFGMTANVVAATLSGFSDMPQNWSTTAIDNAIKNGLLAGANGQIMPNAKLTRAEMAAIVNRAFGTTAKGSLTAFSDVKNSAWYYDDLAKAVNMGTFRGSNGKLNPDKAITREEAFVVLAAAFRLTGADATVLSKFSDAKTISSWAKPAVAALVAAGYAKGSAGKLSPQANITRAEFAQIMDNLITCYFQVAGTYTSVPDGNIMINTPNITLKGVTVKGDLIIGDGVGNGEVTLDSVKVTGRTVVRGGGVNSIKIIGASDAGTVVVARVDGQVRVAVSGDAKVQIVVVADGSDDVIVEGKIGTVDIKASGVTVTAKNAQIGTVNVAAEGAKIAVGAGTTVDKIKLDAPKAVAEVAGTVKSVEATKAAEKAAVTSTKTGKIDLVKTEAVGTTVTGTGTVTKVEANANNVKVDTPNTAVSAGAGTTGVAAGGATIEAGKTGTTSSTTTSAPGGGSSGGGSSGGSSAISVSGVTVSNTIYSDTVNVTARVANAGASDTATVVFAGTGTRTRKLPEITVTNVPIVNGSINLTEYGLYNDTYNVTVSVGTASASTSQPVMVYSPLMAEGENNELYLFGNLLLSDFGNGKPGLLFCFWDDGSMTGGASDYLYSVIATNLASGATQTLTANAVFDSVYFEERHTEGGYLLGCNPDNYFTEGNYAITLQVKSAAAGNLLVGEASFEIAIVRPAPTGLVPNFVEESLSGYNKATMEYQIDSGIKRPLIGPPGPLPEPGMGEWLSDTDLAAAGSLTNMIPVGGPQICLIRLKGVGSVPPSRMTVLPIPPRPQAPVGLTTVPLTAQDSTDGKITGLSTAAIYQYKLKTAGNWTDAALGVPEISGLPAGIYYVRIKATAENFSSNLATVLVLANGATAPAAPNIISAAVYNDNPAKLLVTFDKAMSATGLVPSDFVVQQNGSSKNIASVGLKNGDASTLELTMVQALRADGTITVAYTAGTATADDGVALATITPQNVDNQLMADLQVTLSTNVANIHHGSMQTYINSGDGSYFNAPMKYVVTSNPNVAKPAVGTKIADITDVKGDIGDNWQIAGATLSDYLVVYAYEPVSGRIIGFGKVQVTADNIGTNTTITNVHLLGFTYVMPNGSDYARGTTAENGTTAFVFKEFSSVPLTIAVGGSDSAAVAVGGTATEPIITVNTADIAAAGGSKTFTLSVSDGVNSDNYTVTVNVEGPATT